MAKKDWEEIERKLETASPKLLANFIGSGEPFFPSETFKNPFLGTSGNFSATQFNKPKPGNWIPLYKSSELSDPFINSKTYSICIYL